MTGKNSGKKRADIYSTLILHDSEFPKEYQPSLASEDAGEGMMQFAEHPIISYFDLLCGACGWDHTNL